MSDFSIQIKQSINGDEYYTPENAVNMILPYIQGGGLQNDLVPVR